MISRCNSYCRLFCTGKRIQQQPDPGSDDNVEEKLFKAGFECRQKEGNLSSTWVLLDYGDVIVHVFSKEDRLFYDLERIWRDGKVVGSVEELD